MEQPQQFEIHLTVDVQNSVVLSQRFLCLCQEIQAKALEIILARGQYPHQMMLSKMMTGYHVQDILSQVKQWISLFKQYQLEILRTKIEVPLYANIDYDIQYYEWHGLVKYYDVPQLEQLCHKEDIYLSYNALKDQKDYRFMTLREYLSQEKFEIRLKQLKEILQYQDRQIFKEISEMCIYDSNTHLDHGWLEITSNR